MRKSLAIISIIVAIVSLVLAIFSFTKAKDVNAQFQTEIEVQDCYSQIIKSISNKNYDDFYKADENASTLGIKTDYHAEQDYLQNDLAELKKAKLDIDAKCDDLKQTRFAYAMIAFSTTFVLAIMLFSGISVIVIRMRN